MIPSTVSPTGTSERRPCHSRIITTSAAGKPSRIAPRLWLSSTANSMTTPLPAASARRQLPTGSTVKAKANGRQRPRYNPTPFGDP